MKPLTPPDLRRVAVVGTSCVGKSTFARGLATLSGATHVEMDTLYWLPNWVVRPREEFLDALATVVAGERWILDGNYSFAREFVWSRVTAIVWLDYSFPVVFGRALRRTTWRVVTRQELFSGNRETLRQALFSRNSILWWVLMTYRRRRREYRQLTAELPEGGPRAIVLRSPAEAERFLSVIEGRNSTE